MEDGGEGVVIIDRHNSSSTAFVCQKNYNLHLDAAPLRAAPRPDVMQQVISRMNVTKKREGKKQERERRGRPLVLCQFIFAARSKLQ